jgi:monoamine oxidase
MDQANIIIIGGGLAGLTTAYLLEKESYAPVILEARDRLGGRIHTYRSKNLPPLEMGATWLGQKHEHLINLLEELDIGIYEQYMGATAYYEPISTSPPQLVQLPKNDEPTYRIEGGSDNLINTLQDKLQQTTIRFGQPVTAIQNEDKTVSVTTTDQQFKTGIVISTLPPKLLDEYINFTPSLPASVTDLIPATQTWMAESIKVALTYDRPFWRDDNTSGTIMSNVGPITEMYDHSDQQASHFALKGFMQEAYHSISKQERRELVVNQLQKFYGDRATSFNTYQELVWKDEPYTFAEYYDHILPHQHNGEAIFREAFWDGLLLLAGSETASAFPGYMDGAVESARGAVERIFK